MTSIAAKPKTVITTRRDPDARAAQRGTGRMTPEKQSKEQPEYRVVFVGITPELILKAQRALVRAQLGEWAAADAEAAAK